MQIKVELGFQLCPRSVHRKQVPTLSELLGESFAAAALGPSAGVLPQEPCFSQACATPEFVYSLNRVFFFFLFFPPSAFRSAQVLTLSVPKLLLCSLLSLMIGSSSSLSGKVMPLLEELVSKNIFQIGDLYYLRRSLFQEAFITKRMIILF